MFEMSQADFQAIVAGVLDRIPHQIARRLDNVAFVVEDDAPDHDPHLLGHFDGFPVTAVGEGGPAGALPDKITIYRLPTLRMCETIDQVIEEVSVTVIHEIGHYFGIDDARLHELGWA
ncbi:metallopeptidase family protein [Rarobacter incanus]|uniref:Putative Zn-dependent protease with MMP-like domain n=1 Tax=Rarobacter incanus TaxID=153494 RepID=A0A542SQK6_9MICO|nr:metallopeptidase family protein [Rarobacter incanus]TQK76878.1 putative Zn-dependent protease with MMP-like domain [Rarobacter incanus]